MSKSKHRPLNIAINAEHLPHEDWYSDPITEGLYRLVVHEDADFFSGTLTGMADLLVKMENYLKERHGFDSVTMSINQGYDETASIRMFGQRMETDDERDARDRANRARRRKERERRAEAVKQMEDQDLQNYLRLKEKFEGKQKEE